MLKTMVAHLDKMVWFYDRHTFWSRVALFVLLVAMWALPQERVVAFLYLLGWLIPCFVIRFLNRKDYFHEETRYIVGLFVLLFWSVFAFVAYGVLLERESVKAQTFCGKIVEQQGYMLKARVAYAYTVENEHGVRRAFPYFYDKPKWGNLGTQVCVKFIPHEKSVFLYEDELLDIQIKQPQKE